MIHDSPAESERICMLSPYIVAAVLLVAAVLWGRAIWEIYFRIPVIRDEFVDFDLQTGPLTHFVMHHVAWCLPIVATLLLGVAWRTKSRFVWSMLLLWLPLIAAAAGYVTRLVASNRLLEAAGT